MNLQIISQGAPPQRHADRIIWEMMRQLAAERADHLRQIATIIKNSKDGSPKAQAKLRDRLLRANIGPVKLEPGKRGKYMIWFYSVFGWDLQRDFAILPGDTIPEQPQIACNLTILSGGKGSTDVHSSPVLFITHHVLSRAAQRFALRTPEHMTDAVQGMLAAAMKLLIEGKNGEWKRWIEEAPADGYRVPVQDKATLVLKRHETHTALVATTIF